MPDGVSDLAVGYGSGAEPGFWFLLVSVVVLLAVVLHIKQRRRTASC
jgi:hypothetical protein